MVLDIVKSLEFKCEASVAFSSIQSVVSDSL